MTEAIIPDISLNDCRLLQIVRAESASAHIKGGRALKIRLLAIASLSLVSWTCLYGDINTTELLKSDPKITQGLLIPIPDQEQRDKWTLIFQEVVPTGSWVMEWIPKGEDINNWSELVQIQFFPASLFKRMPTANEFAAFFIRAMNEKFPEINAKQISQAEDVALIEWALTKETAEEKPQSEVTAFFATPEGIYRAAYTKKVPDMDEGIKKIWIDRFSNTKIVDLKQAASANKP